MTSITYDQQNLLIFILAALFLFGMSFNHFVGKLEDTDPDHGYTAIWVVAGVLITLIASIPLVGWLNTALILLAFIASGLPMIAGSISRHLRNRQRDRRAQAADLQRATHGD